MLDGVLSIQGLFYFALASVVGFNFESRLERIGSIYFFIFRMVILLIPVALLFTPLRGLVEGEGFINLFFYGGVGCVVGLIISNLLRATTTVGFIVGLIVRYLSFHKFERRAIRAKPSLSTVVAIDKLHERLASGVGLTVFAWFLAGIGGSPWNTAVALFAGWLGVLALIDAVAIHYLKRRKAHGQSALEVRELAEFLTNNENKSGPRGPSGRRVRVYEDEDSGQRIPIPGDALGEPSGR